MSELTLKLVMKFLKQHHYWESLVSLERQSHTPYYHYGKQIDFLRRIILGGDFSEAVEFLSTFQTKVEEKDFKKMCLTIYKQKLLELVDNPHELQLKRLFDKQLVHFCSEQQYQNLFSYLTYRSVKDIPGIPEWSVIRGRINCFEEILPSLQNILSLPQIQDQTLQRLQHIVHHYQTTNHLSNTQPLIVIKKPTQKNTEEEEQNQTHNKVYNQENSKYSILSGSSLRSSHNKEQLSKSKQKKYSQLYQKKSNNLSQKAKPPIIVPKMQKSIHVQLSQSQYQKSQMLQQKIQFKHESNPQSKRQHQQSENSGQDIKSYIKQKPKYNYQINNSSSRKNLSQAQSQIQKNIQHLQQSKNSNCNKYQSSNQNFTFSHHQQTLNGQPIHKVVKLGYISDPKAIRTCQFSQSGKYFSVGTNSSYLKIFDVQKLYDDNIPQGPLNPIYQIDTLHQKSIFCLNWSKKQNSIVTCSNDLTIKLTQLGNNLTNHRTNVIGRHQSCIRMVNFNSDQSKIISCSDDSLIKVWDLGKIKKCTNLKGHESSVTGFKLCEKHGDSVLYSVSKDSTIKRWDLRTMQIQGTSKQHKSQITYIANNTDKLVVSHKNGYISFYQPSTLQVLHQIQIHTEQIRSIDALLDQNTFLTASFDGYFSIFNQGTITNPFMYKHNENDDDKVVFATFNQCIGINGFASTSTLGLCHLYSFE